MKVRPERVVLRGDSSEAAPAYPARPVVPLPGTYQGHHGRGVLPCQGWGAGVCAGVCVVCVLDVCG